MMGIQVGENNSPYMENSIFQAVAFAKKHGADVAVFRNLHGTYMHRPYKICPPEIIERTEYVAVAALCAPKRKKVVATAERG